MHAETAITAHMPGVPRPFLGADFGFTPILGRLSFEGGGNGITLALRALFAIPVLRAVLKIRRVPLAATGRQLRGLLLFKEKAGKSQDLCTDPGFCRRSIVF